MPALGIGVTGEAVTRLCEWCGRKIVARNRNGVEKRYCGRLCKGAFQTAAVRIARLWLEAGQLSTADLKATLQTAAEARGSELSAGGEGLHASGRHASLTFGNDVDRDGQPDCGWPDLW